MHSYYGKGVVEMGGVVNFPTVGVMRRVKSQSRMINLTNHPPPMNKPSLDEQISNIDAEIEALQEKRRVLVSKAEAAAQKAAKEEENILVPGTPTKSE